MQRTIPETERIREAGRHIKPMSLESGEPDQWQQYFLSCYDLSIHQEEPDTRYYGGWLESQGQKIASHFWHRDQARGTVFILHGYYNHVGLLGHLIRFYLHSGMSVMAFDLPGHGLSEGEPANIDTFHRYTRALRTCLDWGIQQKLAEPWHLAGQSTGGGIITDLLVRERCSRNEYPLSRIMLFAPLIRPRHWHWVHMQSLLVGAFAHSVHRTMHSSSHDLEYLEFLNREPMQSHNIPMAWISALGHWIHEIERQTEPCDFEAWIIQGQEDGTVDWKHNMEVLKKTL